MINTNEENFYNIGYCNGYLDALKLFAHWRDGIQYVGTSGMTLKEAIEEFEEKHKKPEFNNFSEEIDKERNR